MSANTCTYMRHMFVEAGGLSRLKSELAEFPTIFQAVGLGTNARQECVCVCVYVAVGVCVFKR